MEKEQCTCGNPEYGFNCMCKFMRENPGDIEFTCEFCGIYNSSKPCCNKCERVE